MCGIKKHFLELLGIVGYLAYAHIKQNKIIYKLFDETNIAWVVWSYYVFKAGPTKIVKLRLKV